MALSFTRLSFTLAELSTTLLVCPHVEGWDDFETFDSFVQHSQEECQSGPTALSLVAFHPSFARWRKLPPDVVAAVAKDGCYDVNGCATTAEMVGGRRVFAHFEEEWEDEHVKPNGEIQSVRTFGRSKSPEQATVHSLDETVLGVRKALLRFDDGAEQVLPTEWIVGAVSSGATPQKHPLTLAPLLEDNWLHASPVPVVHLLRDAELGREALHVGVAALNTLQLRNARLARCRTGCANVALHWTAP
jgi:hypothetical protein